MHQLEKLRRRFDFKSSSFLLLKKVGFFLILFLRTIRFMLAGRPVCRFSVTCSAYALYQLEHEPFFKACMNITKRLFSCTPF